MPNTFNRSWQELYHSGVKGMRWGRHKVRRISEGERRVGDAAMGLIDVASKLSKPIGLARDPRIHAKVEANVRGKVHSAFVKVNSISESIKETGRNAVNGCMSAIGNVKASACRATEQTVNWLKKMRFW